MTAALQSDSLAHSSIIIFTSHSGRFKWSASISHRSFRMTSRTVERFCGVRLGSGNRIRDLGL